MGEAFGCSYLYLTAIDAVRSTTKSALLPNPDFPDVRPHILLSLVGHQGNIAIEDRRTHWVIGCGKGDAALADRVAGSIEARGCENGCVLHAAVLDESPGFRAGNPSVRGSLLWRQRGEFIAAGNGARINLS